MTGFSNVQSIMVHFEGLGSHRRQHIVLFHLYIQFSLFIMAQTAHVSFANVSRLDGKRLAEIA